MADVALHSDRDYRRAAQGRDPEERRGHSGTLLVLGGAAAAGVWFWSKNKGGASGLPPNTCQCQPGVLYQPPQGTVFVGVSTPDGPAIRAWPSLSVFHACAAAQGVPANIADSWVHQVPQSMTDSCEPQLPFYSGATRQLLGCPVDANGNLTGGCPGIAGPPDCPPFRQ